MIVSLMTEEIHLLGLFIYIYIIYSQNVFTFNFRNLYQEFFHQKCCHKVALLHSPLFAVTVPPYDNTSDEGIPDIGSEN